MPPNENEDKVGDQNAPIELADAKQFNKEEDVENPENYNSKTALQKNDQNKEKSEGDENATDKKDGEGEGEGEEGEKKPQFNHKLSFLFATIASLFFGIADYLIALLSIKHGLKWMYPTFMITTVVWTIFHVGKWIKLNRARRAENLEPVPFWDGETSCYCKPDVGAVTTDNNEAKAKYVLNWGAIWVPIRRFAVNLSIYVMLGLTFMWADKANMHTGVITSLFCTSLIFTIIYFRIFHAQHLQCTDYIGILLVVICVVLISISEGGHGPKPTEVNTLEDIEEEESNMEKILAVVFAVGTGVIFSTNSIEMHYSAKTQNVGATQMNIDGNFILGVIVFPLYIYEMTAGGH